MPRLCRQLLCWLLVVQLTAALATAQQPPIVPLKTRQVEEDLRRVETLLEVSGKLLSGPADNATSSDVSVVGKFTYDERLLSPGDETLAGRRSVRHYDQAEATIVVDGNTIQPKLSDDHRLIAVTRVLEDTLVFCPSSLLTREELDLLDMPGDSLLVDALVPGSEVSEGQSWPHSEQLLAGLLGLDAVAVNEVTSTLNSVQGNQARIEMSGIINGAVNGVATEIDLRAKYHFDLESRCVTWFAMVLKEKRSVGHISPGTDVVARVQMKVSPITSSPPLERDLLAGLILEPADTLLPLAFEEALEGFRFYHDRSWHIIDQRPNLLVMRLVERGELIGQCNVSALPQGKSGVSPLGEFQADVKRALGDNFGRFVQASEAETSTGLHVCEVTAEGTASGLDMWWKYFLVSDAEGRRLVFAFTVEQEHAPRLNETDRSMATSVEFFAPRSETTASQPTSRRQAW